MSTVPHLLPAELASRRASVCVLDVREPAEVATGRIPGSVTIPLGELMSRLDAMDPGIPVVTVCRSGGRGRRAAEALAAAGFTVANLDGGMTAWAADGRPVAVD